MPMMMIEMVTLKMKLEKVHMQVFIIIELIITTLRTIIIIIISKTCIHSWSFSLLTGSQMQVVIIIELITIINMSTSQ